MFPRVPSFCNFVLAGFTLAIAPVHAQLAAKSPFLPPQAAASSAPTPGAPLQFVGYMETSEGIQYRIFDPAKKTGAWVRLNEKNPDFDVVVKQHDGAQDTLTVEHQGKTITLAERKAKIVSSGTAAQAMPQPIVAPAQASNVPPAVTQSVVLNPTPADEQRRLDAVAAEVARRRALREQATQQINQGTVPQVTVPQAAQPAPATTNFQTAPGNYQPQNGQNPRNRGPGQGNTR